MIMIGIVVVVLMLLFAFIVAIVTIARRRKKPAPVYEIRTEMIARSFELSPGASAIVTMHAISLYMTAESMFIAVEDDAVVIVRSVKIAGLEQMLIPPTGIPSTEWHPRCAPVGLGWGIIGRDRAHVTLQLSNPHATTVRGRISIVGYPYTQENCA